MTEDQQVVEIKKIAIIGGTGKEGKGLAYRWGRVGYQVLIGSRLLEKAQAASDEINALLGTKVVSGMETVEAAQAADLIVLTVPFIAHVAMLEMLKPHITGKILIDVTVPLVPPKISKVQMPPAGSASLEAHQVLGDGIEVVAAFQNISYEHLLHDDDIGCDVLVCGTSKQARTVVINLVTAAGLIGWDAGPIENSMVVEGMTSILLGLNKQFNGHSAGIKIVGIPTMEH